MTVGPQSSRWGGPAVILREQAPIHRVPAPDGGLRNRAALSKGDGTRSSTALAGAQQSTDAFVAQIVKTIRRESKTEAERGGQEIKMALMSHSGMDKLWTRKGSSGLSRKEYTVNEVQRGLEQLGFSDPQVRECVVRSPRGIGTVHHYTASVGWEQPPEAAAISAPEASLRNRRPSSAPAAGRRNVEQCSMPEDLRHMSQRLSEAERALTEVRMGLSRHTASTGGGAQPSAPKLSESKSDFVVGTTQLRPSSAPRLTASQVGQTPWPAAAPTPAGRTPEVRAASAPHAAGSQPKAARQGPKHISEIAGFALGSRKAQQSASRQQELRQALQGSRTAPAVQGVLEGPEQTRPPSTPKLQTMVAPGRIRPSSAPFDGHKVAVEEAKANHAFGSTSRKLLSGPRRASSTPVHSAARAAVRAQERRQAKPSARRMNATTCPSSSEISGHIKNILQGQTEPGTMPRSHSCGTQTHRASQSTRQPRKRSKGRPRAKVGMVQAAKSRSSSKPIPRSLSSPAVC